MANMEKFTLKYTKTKDLELDHHLLEQIDSVQQYNPIYNIFFELSESNYNHICLNHTFIAKGLDEVMNLETREILKRPVHIKYSPLLDPIRYMIGKYKEESEHIRTLPTYENSNRIVIPKILQTNNASYVDSFFTFLTSKMLNHHNFKHGIDYYGSMLGIQSRFKINVIDEIEYLNNSEFFLEHLGDLVTIEGYEPRTRFANYGSRGNKNKITLLDNDNDVVDLVLDDIDNVLVKKELDEVALSDVVSLDLEMVYEKNKKIMDGNGSRISILSTASNDSKMNYSSEDEVDDVHTKHEDIDDIDALSDGSWESVSDEELSDVDSDCYESDEHVIAYIRDFPIQMIFMEKCQGTLDELFIRNAISERVGTCALFQIIMILLLYQKAFHFTHNDLHANNIMYIKTDQEFLEYCYNNKYYRVPTYGRIFKIIDFGRGIYKYMGKQFCSDSFATGGDAATQYNFEPFFNKKKPRLEPNYAFDLCRLACAIHDFIIDKGMPEREMDEFQKTIHRWCMDDNSKNLLYKSNGEERYPNFKLYKMIARTCHAHTPQEQLKYRIFSQFEVKSVSDDCMNIDKIPCYVK